MSEKRYSTYEAKSRLSEILRKVRSGNRIVISSRGVPVARVIPYSEDEESPEDRIRRLSSIGLIGPARGRLQDVSPLEERPGALDRFLADRD
ncbi:MAG: type II toxin-antitoxin system prevent-host-death family antitoxin [Polyangia bacterium]